MSGWFDTDPSSPVVEYERDDGQRVPVPRSQATLFGFDPAQFAAPPVEPPPVEPPPEAVAPVEVAAPAPAAPVMPGFAALRSPLPEGAASAFGQGVLAPGGPAPNQQEFVPPPMAAQQLPVAPPVEPQGPTLPGVGYIPAASLGIESPAPAPVAPPPPTGPQSMEEADQLLADQRVAMQSRADVEAENLAFAQEQQRAEEQKQLQARWAETQSAIKKAADYKVDPGRKWADMGTGKKIGAIVFAMVSGLGSALKKQGDKNPALDIINAAIDQDISLQMDERAQLGVTAERHRSAYDQLSGVFKSKDAERSARKAAVWSRLEREWSMAEATSGAARVKLSYAELRQQAQQQYEVEAYNAHLKEVELTSKLEHEAAQTEKLRAEAAKLRGEGGGGGGGAGAANWKAAPGQMISGEEWAQLSPTDQKRYFHAPERMGGGMIQTTSEREATVAAESYEKKQVLVDYADEYLINLANDIPGFAGKLASRAWTGEDIARIRSHNEQFKLKLATSNGQGAISDGDRASYEKIIPDPATMDQQGYTTVLQLRANTAREVAASFHRAGMNGITGEQVFGKPPTMPVVKKSDDVLSGGATVARAADGAPDVDNNGDVLVPDEGRQRDEVTLFVDTTRREYIGGGNFTAAIGEQKFRERINGGDGGLKATNSEIAGLTADVLKWTGEATKLKGKGAGEKATALASKMKRAEVAIRRLRGRKDALQKAIDESKARETKKVSEPRRKAAAATSDRGERAGGAK